MKAEDLPAWWTPMQAVAWIVTRDSRIVQWASTADTREATDQEREELDLPDSPGLPLIWVNLHVRNEDASRAAIASLVASLRADRVRCRATWITTGESRDVQADEWLAATLGEPLGATRGPKPSAVEIEGWQPDGDPWSPNVVPPHAKITWLEQQQDLSDRELVIHHLDRDGRTWPDTRWSDPRLRRDDLLREWPVVQGVSSSSAISQSDRHPRGQADMVPKKELISERKRRKGLEGDVRKLKEQIAKTS